MQQTEEYAVEGDFDEIASKEGSFWGKIIEKTRGFLESPYYVVILIILVACISFLLGRISKMGEAKEPVRIVSGNPLNPPYPKGETEKNTSTSNTKLDAIQTASVEASNTDTSAQVKVVGSKNGTKYHLESCPGAKQISEKNKIVFASIEEARSRGYTPASNCKGLK